MMASTAGCQTGPTAMQRAHQAYYQGDFLGARVELAGVVKKDRRQRDVASLDLAIVELAAGEVTAADSLLRHCRNTFDERHPLRSVPSMRTLLTDDRDQPYDAVGYEDVMIRSLLSIASLMSDSGDAEAYAIQAHLRQAELAEDAEQRGLENLGDVYQPLPLAPYIRGLVREATHHDYDDAARAYQWVAQWKPDFPPLQMDIRRVTEGTHSPPGWGVVYLFALVGRGPLREEQAAEATSAALLVADRIVAASSNLVIPPTLAPIPVPAVRIPYSPVEALGATVNGQPLGVTSTITDVAQMALRQVEGEMPWIIARGIVRRTAKKSIVSTSMHSIDTGNGLANLGGALLGSAWEAAERADTRCWSLLPREIQVLRIELPAGKHRLTVVPLGPHGNWSVRPDSVSAVHRQGGVVSSAVEAEVLVRDGMNSYLLAVAPENAVTALCVGHSGTN